MHLARDAVDAQAVGTVGRDLELEHVGGDERQDVGEGRPGHQTVLVEHEDPGVVGADRQLVLGEDHPLGLHAAQLGLAQARAVGHDRAGLRDGDRLAGGDVGRAADDRRDVALADRDLADAQPVGIGVALGLEHAPDDEAIELAHAVVVQRLDLGAGHRQALLELAQRQPGVAMLAQPFERDEHQPNCSRKRRSFS